MADTYFTKETFDLLRKLQAKPEDKEWILSLDQDIALSSELKARVEGGALSAERNEMRKKFYGQHEDKNEEDEERGGDGRFRSCVKDPFDEKLIRQGVWEKLQEKVRQHFEDPEYYRKTFGQDVISGYPQQKWFALYSKRQKGDDPKKSGPRIALVLAPDHLKVAYQSEYRHSRKKLKRGWDELEASRRQEIESSIDTVDVGSKRFEYRVGREANGESEKVDSLEEWVQEQTEGSTGNWSTEIRLMIPKDVVLNTDAADLEEEIATAIEVLFPIYELAVEMNPEKHDSSSEEQSSTATKTVKRIKDLLDLLERKKQIILTGPPGTSKTYTAFQVIHAFSGEKSPIQGDRPYQKLGDYRFDPADKEEGGERAVVWGIVQFHQSYGYEDFVSGIEAESTDDQSENSPGGLKLERVDKVFLSMCEEAVKDPDTPYVLIIDEINRGILGRIFGELILGLEYRGLPIRLQGRNGENGEGNEKKDTITIPDNLYLIGTMNTADRNIALVDHALRRRFRFVDMPPSKAILGEVLARYIKDENKPLQENNRELILEVFDAVQDLFKDDNSSLAGAIDKKNYAVGHTYFMCDTMEDFWDNMHYQVLPLLEEYVREGVLQPDAIGSLKRGEDVEGTEENVTTWLNSSEKADEVNDDDASSEATDADDASSREKVSQQNGTLSA